MAPKKLTKGSPKRGEKVNPTDPRPKIVVETVNSPELPVEEVPFDAIDSPQPAVTTAATTEAQNDVDDDDVDDDVPTQFIPPQIRTRLETRAASSFAGAASLMVKESSAPSLFGRRPGSETAVGQILGSNLDRFGSGFEDPAASDDPLAYGGLFSSNKNRTDSGLGRQAGENMATVPDVGRFGSGLGISEVDYRCYRSGIAATTQPYSAGVDIHGSDGDRHESAAQTGTGIFKNAFADQWTTGMGNQEAEDMYTRTDVINHIIKICGFSEDLLMV
jgi:hypothetical protein